MQFFSLCSRADKCVGLGLMLGLGLELGLK